MHEQTAPVICAHKLSKRYGRRQAVSGLGFTVEAGQICALLGPNGAGKTSTMRMLVGLSSPDIGSVTVLGEPVGLGATVLSRVGVLIDGPAFVPHLTGRANLRLLWSATGQAWPPPALDDALDLAGLGDALDRKVKGYSMGMKQRLILAQALMRKPDVLILDEPANGLDPGEVRALREHLGELARCGAAVLVSSHQLAEVQQLATHAVVLNHGRLIAAGPMGELLGDAGTHLLQADDTARAAAVLRVLPGVATVMTRRDEIVVTAPGVPSRDLVHELVTEGIGVMSVQQESKSLEEAFLTMTEGDGERGAR
ncbi:ATP-binding cassette domain-containing protein [Streptomyces broussonetiae]|uniref:ATP-binding cassette domain-containing protein n=1 Tax=Streptomyces broussonetiae TaxID=2686304 RepID=A0A6I6NCM5_9ACTN|nr:ABC transporter ATP-binding protein [Streptomyces broussonetiae]QHA09172.1 ATP-binding cassette domain-containing protein [Streptomyces broussonetiae]